jgi:hypothetical protein
MTNYSDVETVDYDSEEFDDFVTDTFELQFLGELHSEGTPCHACFGTGLDRELDADCLTCWGDGVV